MRRFVLTFLFVVLFASAALAERYQVTVTRQDSNRYTTGTGHTSSSPDTVTCTFTTKRRFWTGAATAASSTFLKATIAVTWMKYSANLALTRAPTKSASAARTLIGMKCIAVDVLLFALADEAVEIDYEKYE